jgi:hypothetical protein
MLTDRDITIRATAAGKDPNQTRVEEVMTPDVVYCFEDDDARDAALKMEEHQLRRLIVLNRDKRLVGILARRSRRPFCGRRAGRRGGRGRLGACRDRNIGQIGRVLRPRGVLERVACIFCLDCATTSLKKGMPEGPVQPAGNRPGQPWRCFADSDPRRPPLEAAARGSATPIRS